MPRGGPQPPRAAAPRARRRWSRRSSGREHDAPRIGGRAAHERGGARRRGLDVREASSTCVAPTPRSAPITSSTLSRPGDARQVAEARGGDADATGSPRRARASRMTAANGTPATAMSELTSRERSHERIISACMIGRAIMARCRRRRRVAWHCWSAIGSRPAAGTSAVAQAAEPARRSPTPAIPPTCPRMSAFRTVSPASRWIISTTTRGGHLSRSSGRRRRDAAACRRRARASRRRSARLRNLQVAVGNLPRRRIGAGPRVRQYDAAADNPCGVARVRRPDHRIGLGDRRHRSGRGRRARPAAGRAERALRSHADALQPDRQFDHIVRNRFYPARAVAAGAPGRGPTGP